jgi:hypothetical protein
MLLFIALIIVESSAHRITMWWKPNQSSLIAEDVSGMIGRFAVTDVIVYCGYAALADGTFGVDPHPEGGWGNVTLCSQAVHAASSAGLGVQIIVEGRIDGNAQSALDAGGSAFGKSAWKTISSRYPNVTGLNIDWEVGHNKSVSVPSQDEMDRFTADFAAALMPRLSVTVCASQFTTYVSNFSRIIASNATTVFDMGLYHGISSPEWQTKLTTAIANAGSTTSIAAGLALEPKFPWENTTASVVDRFSAIQQSGVDHIALFAWAPRQSGSNFGLPLDVVEEWTNQLHKFAGI